MPQKIDPGRLDMVIRENECVLYYGEKPFFTPAGHEIKHPNNRLIIRILTDLAVGDKWAGIDSFLLFAYQKDFIEKNADLLSSEPEWLMNNDPFIRIKAGGEPFPAYRGLPVQEDGMLTFSVWINAVILRRLNDMIAEHIHALEGVEEEVVPFIALINRVYASLIPGQRSGFHLLSCMHKAGFILPLLLVTGWIQPSEYAKAIVSTRNMMQDIPSWPDNICKFLLQVTGDTERMAPDGATCFAEIFRDASSVAEYLMLSSEQAPPASFLPHLIREGENETVEFKSTLRWDLRAGKTNPAIERASLKTMASFMNSNGGTLLIGVRDDGSIEGIGSDRFANDDKFLLHLWTLIRNCFGRDVSPFIHTSLEKAGELTVCLIQCLPSMQPVFLRQPGFDEEFYVRLGPGSSALDISEALKYIATRFPSARDHQPG